MSPLLQLPLDDRLFVMNLRKGWVTETGRTTEVETSPIEPASKYRMAVHDKSGRLLPTEIRIACQCIALTGSGRLSCHGIREAARATDAPSQPKWAADVQ